MPLPKNNQSPCFCSSNCPPPSKPYLKYFVQTEPGSVFTVYNLGKLFHLRLSLPADKFCLWGAAEPTPAYVDEVMVKQPYLVPDDDLNYRFTVDLHELPINHYEWRESVTWLPANLPYDPNELPACDVTSFTPLQFSGTGGIILITVRSCPEWLCTDAEARTWATDNPLV